MNIPADVQEWAKQVAKTFPDRTKWAIVIAPVDEPERDPFVVSNLESAESVCQLLEHAAKTRDGDQTKIA